MTRSQVPRLARNRHLTSLKFSPIMSDLRTSISNPSFFISNFEFVGLLVFWSLGPLVLWSRDFQFLISHFQFRLCQYFSISAFPKGPLVSKLLSPISSLRSSPLEFVLISVFQLFPKVLVRFQHFSISVFLRFIKVHFSFL